MFVLTFTDARQLIVRFAGLAKGKPADALTYRFDIVLVAVMTGLAVVILVDSFIKWKNLFLNKRQR